MYPASKHKNDQSIVFQFKKETKPPPPKLKPILKPSENRQSLAFPKAPNLKPDPRLRGPPRRQRLEPLRSNKQHRHLVVRMPSASYPRALSPPSQPMTAQHSTVDDNSGSGKPGSANRRSVAFLPPINVQSSEETPRDREADDEKSISDRSDTRMLYVPDSSPDPKFESTELQRRFSQDRPYVKVTYRKPPTHNSERSAPIPRRKTPEPKPLRYVHKHNSLYNSWEVGLHNYRIHDEADEEEEPLTYRFKLNRRDEDDAPKPKPKRPKTPPKDPFKEAILNDIDTRRKNKVKDAVTLSSDGDLVKGKPVVEDPPTTADLYEMQRGSQGFHRIRQLNLPGSDYRNARDMRPTVLLDPSEKPSALFVKKPDSSDVRRPFEPPADVTPRLLTGKTVLRNPLSPVPLRHRYNPVVVVKSKLDDYTGAIKQFLEQVVEEQRNAVYDKQPLPLHQSIENMVVYKDFDTIQYFKAMQKQLKQSQAQTHDLQKAQQYNFKAPSSHVAKGMAKVQKLGAINAHDLEPLPGSGLKPKSVVGQGVFLTNPQGEPEMSHMQRILMHHSGLGTPTSAPPNTPHVGKLY